MNLALDLHARNGKLGHQSSASARLLDCPYHLSASVISQLLCCIYTTEGCCYGDMRWWLFDVTWLHQGNRVASVRGCWGMRKLGYGNFVHVCVSSLSLHLTSTTTLSLLFYLFHAFMLGWLLSFPYQHSCMLLIPASMHVLLCFWSCSTFSLLGDKADKKRRALEGKSLYNNTAKRSHERLLCTKFDKVNLRSIIASVSLAAFSRCLCEHECVYHQGKMWSWRQVILAGITTQLYTAL